MDYRKIIGDVKSLMNIKIQGTEKGIKQKELKKEGKEKRIIEDELKNMEKRRE